jgi:crotonobetainyl-CoA:carnitine CoA-transferase CaiB-like acyl-CoA transferase
VAAARGRAGNDLMGGMFGPIAILAALRKRAQTGRANSSSRACSRTTVCLVARHLCSTRRPDKPAAPTPARLCARAICDVLDTFDGDQGFVGVMSDSQWKVFCESFGRMLRSGQQRVAVCWLQPITPHLAAFARKSSRPVDISIPYRQLRIGSRFLARPGTPCAV